MSRYRPGVLPRDPGDPTLWDALNVAIDEGVSAHRSQRQRQREDELMGMERAEHAQRMAGGAADLHNAGIRRRSEFEEPEPVALEHPEDPFAGEQLGMAGQDHDVGIFEGQDMGMGRVSPGPAEPPQRPRIIPGQFNRELGGFIKDPVAFQQLQMLEQEAARGPEAIPLTDDFELDPSATPAAQEARAAEVERAREAAEQEELRRAVTGAMGGDGEALADLLALRPDLIDRATGIEGLNPVGAGRDPIDRKGLTMDQALRRLESMYAVRNELGDITGFTLSQPEMFELAEQMVAGQDVAFPPTPDEEEPVLAEEDEPEGPGFGTRIIQGIRGMFGGDEAEAAPAPDPVAGDVPRGNAADRSLSNAQLAAVDSAMAVVRELGEGFSDDELRELMEDEGYEPEVIDKVLEVRPR